MDADQFLRVEPDGFHYSLLNGVVIMSPKPSYERQDMATYLAAKLLQHVEQRDLGKVIAEVEIRFAADLVYVPDIAFFAKGRVPARGKKVSTVPDLTIELLSPSNRPFDLVTKKADYARFGVREYWAIDPETFAAQCWRLQDGAYVAMPVEQERVVSEVIEGFVLDLASVRKALGA